MAKACCRKKGSSGSNCEIQPNTDFTVLLTVGQGNNIFNELVYGFSDGNGGRSSDVFGSISYINSTNEVLNSLFTTDGADGGTEVYATLGDQIDQGILYKDGVLIDITESPLVFTSEDIGKTYCISLGVIQGG